ncbi:MAG: fasciclin domain-containing protein [Sphingomicrobium sp.]
MVRNTVLLSLALALVAGCSKPVPDNSVTTAAAPTSSAAKAAGSDTIAKGFAGMAGDTKFIAAIKSAGMEPTFAGPGPYTVLVPDDNAFLRMPPGALDGIMKPGEKKKLVRLLTMHVLPGTILSADIANAIDAHGGTAKLMTMAGEPIKATKNGDKILLTDASGDKAVITTADAKRSNGVVHQIDGVLIPKG